jgi:kojibiose phosphorylase
VVSSPHLWLVEQTRFVPENVHHDETVFTIGNGYLGTRGTFEEPFPLEWRATLLQGVFGPVPLAVTELAGMPDWTAMSVLVDGHGFAMPGSAQHVGSISDFRRTLDMRTGVLTRCLTWTTPSGFSARIQWGRFACLHDPHCAVVTVRVTPDTDCDVEVRVPVAAAAATVSDGIYHLRHTRHLRVLDGGDQVAGVHVCTQDGRYEVALACRVVPVGRSAQQQRWELPEAVSQAVRFAARADETVGVDKTAAWWTSRDGVPGTDVAAEALRRARQAEAADALAVLTAERWAQDWAACDVRIDGDDRMQRAVRFNIFQLLVAAPRTDDQVSIGAKALSGFGYHGHVFWDAEIFMVPLFAHTLPDVARNMLDYRWHRLLAARARAAQHGFEGAQFPWESADTGEEVTPRFVPAGTEPGALVPVRTGDIEIHISADIAHAAVRYLRVTGDEQWFAARGAELVLAVATFYASRAEQDADGTVHYRDVIGPDEYHEHVDDNAYTNAMARWTIRTGLQVLSRLERTHPVRARQLRESLDLTRDRLDRWRAVADAIVVPVLPGGRVLQFAGYDDLVDVDLDDYEPRTTSMYEVLGAEGVNAHTVLKQPDVLMAMLLLEDDFSDEQRQVNYEHYSPRTDHTYGSSLGPAVQAIIAARAGLADDAVVHFRRAALGDLDDVRGNADDGIHAASCGGVWQAVVFGFAGVVIDADGVVSTHPALPKGWRRLAFCLTVRGERHEIEIEAVAPVAPADRGIQAFIFDLDGVITDTAENHYLAWKRMADDEGIPMDRALGDQLRGVARRPALLRIIGDRPYTEQQITELMQRKNSYYVSMLQSVTPDDLMPGIAPLIAALKAAGLKVAVASASKNARSVLRNLRIAEEFDAISDGYSVTAQKPDPALFLHAAEQLGVEPTRAVVVEDAAAGIEAAIAGGFRSVGVGPPERVGDADVVLPGFADVSLDDLLTRLEH